MREQEKYLYWHLSRVLDVLEVVFGMDAPYTELQLYSSLDNAREDWVPEHEDDDNMSWDAFNELANAMQGKAVSPTDWGHLEYASATIADAAKYCDNYIHSNEL